MATPMNDEQIEKLLEPFRNAVKLQVGEVENDEQVVSVLFFSRVILSNN